MRKLFVSLLAVVALAATPVAFSQDSACKLTGGWVGYIGGYATWVAAVDGVSNSAGTITIDYPALDPALFGLYPTGVRAGILRGVWERTGGRSFAYTTLAVVVDATGQPVWLGKLAGTETLGPDCNVEKITAVFYAYAPDADPFSDAPLYTFPQPDHYGYRMTVDSPAQ